SGSITAATPRAASAAASGSASSIGRVTSACINSRLRADYAATARGAPRPVTPQPISPSPCATAIAFACTTLTSKAAGPHSYAVALPWTGSRNGWRMRVLGIETSCDETAAAIVTDTGRQRILADLVRAQLDEH